MTVLGEIIRLNVDSSGRNRSAMAFKVFFHCESYRLNFHFELKGWARIFLVERFIFNL